MNTVLASTDQAIPYDLLDPLSVYKITASIGSSGGKAPQTTVSQELSVMTAGMDPSIYLDRPVETLVSLDPFDYQYKLAGPDADDMYVRGVVLPPKKEKWDYPIQPRIGIAAGYLIPDPDQGEKFVSSRQSLLVESRIRRNFHILTG
jgi:hypothetical protein